MSYQPIAIRFSACQPAGLSAGLLIRFLACVLVNFQGLTP